MSATPARAPSVAARAALVVALLVLFYVLALGCVVVLALITYEAFVHTNGAVSGKLGFFTAVVALALGRRSSRSRSSPTTTSPGRP